MFEAILAVSGLAGLFGVLLGYTAIRFRVEGDPVVEQIDQILPQTQCGQCGYPGCRPYAEAIAAHAADINRCPPGGETVMRNLADLLGRDPQPLDDDNSEARRPQYARIDESRCIGCTKCLQACPVDAIVGAAKQLHTVVAVECTGCGLCVSPCPVDCIALYPVPQEIGCWRWPYPEPRRYLFTPERVNRPTTVVEVAHA